MMLPNLEFSHYSEASRLSLEPTQPHIQRVPGLFSGDLKGQRVMLTTFLYIVPRLS
jgi:hypothetical protein